MHAFHENPYRKHTELTFINPFKGIITQCMFLGLNNVFCVYTEVLMQDDTVTFE